jgi:hypothetical protein
MSFHDNEQRAVVDDTLVGKTHIIAGPAGTGNLLIVRAIDNRLRPSDRRAALTGGWATCRSASVSRRSRRR